MIDVRRNVAVFHESLTPAGQQHDRRRGRSAFDGSSDAAAIDVRHAEIRDHHVERLVESMCVGEGVDARLPAVGGRHLVTVALQRGAQRFEHQRIVVDDEDGQRARRGVECSGLRCATAATCAAGNTMRIVVP